MTADPANLPQIGVTTLAGRAGRGARRTRAGPDRRLPCCAARAPRRSRRRSSSARAATGRPRILYCERGVPRALARLAVGQRQRRVPRALRAAAAGLRRRCRSATSRRCEAQLARGDVAAFIVEPIQGKGVYVAPDGYLAARRRAVPRGRRAADRRRGADRPGADRALPGAGALAASGPTWSRCPRRCRAASCRSARCSPAAPCSTRRSTRWRRSVVHGSTFGNGDFAAAAGAGHADGDRAARGWSSARGLLGDLLMSLTAPAGRHASRSSARSAGWG